MTRINIHVNPKELSKKHLFAEYREAKRIPNAVRSGKAVLKDIPANFTLGKGHVKYFYNKLGYLQKRIEALYFECLERGINVQDYRNCFEGIDTSLMNDIPYNEKDRQIVLERINERLNGNSTK